MAQVMPVLPYLGYFIAQRDADFAHGGEIDFE